MHKIKAIADRLMSDIKEYGWAAVVFIGYYVLVHMLRTAFCPMLHMTGIPCAGCGLTRAFLYILQGDFVRAAYINPMAYVIIVFIIYCGFWRYVKGTKIKGFSVCFGILIGIMLLFYLGRMYLYFPDRVPYTYWQDNVLAKRLQGYEEFIDRVISGLRKMRS